MRLFVTLAVLLAGCGGPSLPPPQPTPEPAPAAAAQPTGALAAHAALLGDWKLPDGSEAHYVFAGDAILGVRFVGEGFETTITTAEPEVKTKTYKDGASEVVSDGPPAGEGATKIETAREPAIEKAEHDFAEATAARGVDGWVDWFDEHGAQWDGQEGKRVEGAAAIRAHMTEYLGRPGFRLEWRPIASGLGPSGQLGYTVGTWEGVMIGADGKREVKRHGAFVTTWKRQADGGWKVLFDTGDAAG